MFRFALRLTDELHKKIGESAARSHRSINGEILEAIEFYLAHRPVDRHAVIDEDVKEKTGRKKKT